MEEYTNHPEAEELDLEDIDFKEEFEDEPETEEQDTEEQEETEPEEQHEETPETKNTGIRVKFNGEEKELTAEEAVSYAQMGMNYPKVKERLDALEAGGAQNAMELVQLLAEENNMSVSEYIEYAQKNLSQSSVNAQLRKVQKEFPDLAPEVQKELAESRAAKKSAQLQAEKAAKQQAPWDELAKEYPNIKTAEDLPAEVQTAINSGKSPLMAMREHEIAQLKKQLEEKEKNDQARQQNEKNRKAAIGSASGSKQEHDPIAELLLSDDY